MPIRYVDASGPHNRQAIRYTRNNLTARTPGGRLVHFTGDEKRIGTYQNLIITGCSTWALFGELAE